MMSAPHVPQWNVPNIMREMPAPSNVVPQEVSRPPEVGSWLPVNTQPPLEAPTVTWKSVPPRENPPLPIIPLPEKTVNEILKEVKEVEKRGEIPIAVGPGGVVEIPKSIITETKLSTEHEKLSLKPTPQEEKQLNEALENFTRNYYKVSPHITPPEHLRFRPPIILPLMGGTLAPAPGVPAVSLGSNQQGTPINLP